MKVYQWKPRDIISRPGAYVGVPMEVYHSGKLCAGRSVSSTGLKRVRKSPLHYWRDSPYNPAPVPVKPKAALGVGQAAHCRAFEPEKFDSRFEVSRFRDYKTDAAQEWRDSVIADNRTPLRGEEFAMIARMADKLREDETAVSLFTDGLAEITYAAQDAATGIWMLTRPDWLPASTQRGPSDYKTCLSAEPAAWGRQAFDLGYDVQVGLALHVLELIEGETRPTFWMVAQEKDEPHIVSTFRWEQDQIRYGMAEMRGALDRLGAAFQVWDNLDPAVKAKAWPAYTTGPTSVVTPNYLRRAVEEVGY